VPLANDNAKAYTQQISLATARPTGRKYRLGKRTTLAQLRAKQRKLNLKLRTLHHA